MPSNDDLLITDLFVYGTLKRGECRESLWPRKPAQICEAFILARMYDLRDYPAIRVDPGNTWDERDAAAAGDDDLDWVAGELWSFDLPDVSATIAVLDEIEQTNQPGYRNLYDQVLVRAHDRPRSQRSRLAMVYQYSNAQRLDPSRRLTPRAGTDVVSWSAAGTYGRVQQ